MKNAAFKRGGVATLLAACLFLSACGGGGEETTTPTSSRAPEGAATDSSTSTTVRAVTDLDKAKLALLSRDDFPINARIAEVDDQIQDPTLSDASDECLGIAQTKQQVTADVTSDTYTVNDTSYSSNVVVARSTADVVALNRAQNSLVDARCFLADPAFAARITSVGPVPGFPRNDQNVSVRVVAQAPDGRTLYIDTIGTTVGRFASSATITTFDEPLATDRQKNLVEELRTRLLSASTGKPPVRD